MRGGAPPTTSRSARSICSTIRCSREPLRLEHIKPRLLGHWGTTPGLNFIYVHLNRVIKARDLDMIYICRPRPRRPGHGRQHLARRDLQRDLSAHSAGRAGHAAAVQAILAFPAASPAMPRRRRPGSIHEGGELGYALSHAYGAAFDNPDLIVACVVGDGEAETGPLATSWHSNKFLNPATTARCCRSCISTATRSPIPRCWRASAQTSCESCSSAMATSRYFVEGDEPGGDASAHGGDARHASSTRSRAIQQRARAAAGAVRAPALADDHPADAQGLDRPEGGRRAEDRRLLARRTRCRWRTWHETRSMSSCSRSG